MKRGLLILTLNILLCAVSAIAGAPGMKTIGPERNLSDGQLEISYHFVLDSMKLGANKQLYISPIVEGPDGNKVALPSLLINGRNMHYAYERGSISRNGSGHNYDVLKEVCRNNGKAQTVDYKTVIPFQSWMRNPLTKIHLVVDSCGCGKEYASSFTNPTPLDLNPFEKMRVAFVTPEVTELPVSIHEGRARVQFEVDRTVLHDQPYVCRNGQKIDNRSQLKVIDDSVKYALADPNVEIAKIKITGYASPESPYLHNQDLSTGRSRALAEYLADRYNLPREQSEYDAVPENWREFRDEVLKSKELTEQQRSDLLALIDAPVYGPSDYDAKEKILKTDKRFAKIYKSYILPTIFPRLRATEFSISTRLKPLSDEKLAEVMKKTPELMSLNQMMRVARLYPEGSKEFNEAIETALRYYPHDKTANLNAAIAAIGEDDYRKAEDLLKAAGDTPESENARGVIATRKGDFEAAARHFKAAGNLKEAKDNLKLIE